MRLTRFSLRHPVIVAMLCVATVLYGALSWRALGINLFPNVAFPVVAVAAAYPGASPSEMERLVIKPIEDQLDGIENLDRLTATAEEGIATIVVRFKLDTDVNYETIDTQRRVDIARIYMPTDLDPPFVTKISTATDPILQTALSSRTLTAAQLGTLVTDRLVPRLKSVAGVQDVAVSGDTKREFQVEPDPLRLLGAGATLADLTNAIQRNNANLPGGRMDAGGRETTVSIHGDVEQPQDLLRLPIAIPGGAPSTLRLGDVARVRDGHVEDRQPTAYDGRSAVLLQIQRQVGADTVTTTRATREALRALAREYPEVRFAEISASSDYTQAAIGGVLQSLVEGIVLTAIVMLLFLHAWRNAVVVMIAIPVSLFATFIAMRMLGFTIDLISMMGLGLTIGILVDDSIVVLENITRHRDLGEPPMEAAIAGRTEIGGAAIAITLVDVVVFLPIGFLSGIIGKYMREFGVVIVIATLVSLLVSFTLTPLLAGRWSVIRRATGVPRWAAWFQVAFERLATVYRRRALPWALRRRTIVVLGSFALVAASIALVPLGFIGSEFIPSSDTGVVTGSLTYSVGTPLETTRAGLARIASRIRGIDGVASVVATAGAKSSGYGRTTGGYVGEFTVVLAKDRRRETDRVAGAVRALGAEVPGARYEVAKEGGAGSGGAVSYTVSGPDAALQPAAEKLAAFIRARPGAINVHTSSENEGPRLDIRIDPIRASALGVAPGDAAAVARAAIGGVVATKVRTETQLVDVRLQLPYAQRNDRARIAQTAVRASDGSLVPLARLAAFRDLRAPTKIERENRRRVLHVTGDLDPAAHVSLGAVIDPVDRALKTPGFLPDGVAIVASDDADLYAQTFSSMGLALVTSFSLVYMLMTILYGSFVEPFVVMFSVPVAIIGALGGLAIRHQTLNLFSLIAIVMLFGLVAKNGILLVDYANRLQHRGYDVVSAMREAAATRFRPILMTTCAMIFGMLPLSLGLTEGAQERASMGTVLIGGLTSSLILTLLLVPVIYVSIMGPVIRRRARRAGAAGEAALPALEREAATLGR